MRRFDPGTFMWGLLFTALGAALVLEAADVWELHTGDLRWLAPIVVVALGVMLVVGSMVKGRRGGGDASV